MVTSLIVWPLLASMVVAAPRANSLFEAKASLVVSRNLRARGDKSGSVTASWNKNVELLSPIDIAGKNYSVVLDTGSADMWMFCTDGDDHMETDRSPYNPSTGKKMDGAKFDIKYGSGHAKGSVYTDKVTIGGITVDQAIGCATDVDDGDVGDRPLDGLIGLGFDSGSKTAHNGHDKPVASATSSAMNSISTKGGGIFGLLKTDKPHAQLTFAENAYGQMKEGFFTADLKKGEDGVYNFGFIDDSRFSTPITYMPVINWNQWIVKMSGYQIGSDGQKQKAERKVLIDTGTTNILADKTIAKEYYDKVPKSKTDDHKSWTVPCDPKEANMPELRLVFTPPKPDGITHYPSGKGGLKQEEYTAVIPGIYLIGNASGKNDNMCQAALTSNDKGNGWDMILGDAFLVSQLVVFDLMSSNGMTKKGDPTQGQIGFAPKPEGPKDHY